MMRYAMALALLPALGGCASIVEGTDQQVVVNSNPDGAKCVLERDGKIIGIADPTPQTLTLDKSKNDVTVTCDKRGYKKSIAILDSEFQAMTMGNLIFGGVIGLGVDAASGALNEYDSAIIVPMTAESPAAVIPAPVILPAAPIPAAPIIPTS